MGTGRKLPRWRYTFPECGPRVGEVRVGQVATPSSRGVVRFQRTMRRWLAKAALLVMVGTTIGCDQVSKHFASVYLRGCGGQSFFGDSLRLEYAENPGAFLSLGAGLPAWARTALFSILTGALLVTCVIVGLRERWADLPLLGLALVFAGGVSNLLDRVARGSVVDFLNVGLGTLRTGVFNVADMAILLGIAVLALCRRSRDGKRERATR
jgi:signal peptidase II